MIIKCFLRFFAVIIILICLFPINSYSSISSQSEKIPDSIISMSSGYVIIVDKQYQKIYAFLKTNTFSKVFEAPCSTGKNSGAKNISGDAKTPNGIFFVTKILRKPGPPETYGSLAFPLNYPTLADKRAGRNGYSIWIHGTTKPLSPQQTNGCVVLSDSDLKRLTNLIYFNRTPVLIQESINWVSQNQSASSKDELERILLTWNKSFIDGDIKTLDSLYLPGTEIKGKRRDDIFNKLKLSKSLNKHFLLEPRDVYILRQDNSAVIVFDQIFAVNNDNTFQGLYNKLILERVNNKWYIVDDTAASPLSDKNLAKTNINSDKTKTPSSDSVNVFLNKWISSWKSGDMKNYRNCYASDFRSNNMSLNDWINHKNDVRKRSKNINIRIDNLKIKSDNSNATASFIQYYSSSILKSRSAKRLELKKISGEWKIVKETT